MTAPSIPSFTTLVLLYIACSCFKLLLAPAYFSTDFEVHRNWLAITSRSNGLPWTQWYYDESSPNSTLDYPPLFAFFEYFLSNVVIRSLLVPAFCASQLLFSKLAADDTRQADWCSTLQQEVSKMLDLKNGVGYASEIVVLVHRFTVVLSDLVFFLALWRFLSHRWQRLSIQTQQSQMSRLLYVLFFLMVFLAPGFIIVDHIHFQYNGILFGVLIYFLCFVQEKLYLMSGVTFAALLMFKHLFMYMVPAVFSFLLMEYCIKKGRFYLGRFIALGICVLSVIAVSMLPVIVNLDILRNGDMNAVVKDTSANVKQILARLFPFARGLTHAYWAPNFWALYNAADKIALVALKKFVSAKYAQIMESQGGEAVVAASLTGGLVGTNQGTHLVLPVIKPIYTIALSLFFSFVLCAIILLRRKANGFSKLTALIMCLTHASFSFFMFGWHVHEKAVMMMLVPLSLLPITLLTSSKSSSPSSPKSLSMRNFVFLSIVGTYSLFPLLFKPTEFGIRNAILVVYALLLVLVSRLSNTIFGQNVLSINMNILEKLYLLGLIALEVITIAFELKLGSTLQGLAVRYPFVPLMLTSVYCSLGVIYSWIRLFIEHVASSTASSKKAKTQ